MQMGILDILQVHNHI